MTAYLYRMPAGIPGDINRAFVCDIVTEVVTPYGTTGAPSAYGVPVVIDASTHNVRTMVASDTAVYGVLVRPYPTNSTQDALGVSTPPTAGPVDILTKGCISVLLSGPTAAAKGSPLNVWTAVSSTGHTQGTFEAAATGGSTIVAPGLSMFRGPADTGGITEIMFNM